MLYEDERGDDVVGCNGGSSTSCGAGCYVSNLLSFRLSWRWDEMERLGMGWDGTRRVGSNKRQIYSSSSAQSIREASRQRKRYL